MAREETKLVLGRGEVYFEPFADGTQVGEGERYIGNTTTFQLARALTRIERFTSYKGQKVARKGIVTEESHTVQFITDNISIENVGLWFSEETGQTEFQSQSLITESIMVRQRRFYQLGKTAQAFGTRYVEDVTVRIEGVLVPMTGNWNVERAFGRLEILDGAPNIPDGSIIDVTFQWRTVTSETVRSQAKDLFGSLRFIATNPVGPRRHYFFPLVKLSARGSFDLKGDEWQQIPFEAEAFRLSPNTDQVYLDAVTYIKSTLDEEAIVSQGGITLDEFPYWEEQFDIIMNINLPASDLGQSIL